jgi:hypothetical protein
MGKKKNTNSELLNKVKDIAATPYHLQLEEIINVFHDEVCYQQLKGAYHEAAHAVALYTLRMPFNYVTIILEGNSFGVVLRDLPSYNVCSIKNCTILLAGFIAEHVVFDDADRHEQDFWALEEIIKMMTKGEEEVLLRQQLTDFAVELIEGAGFWEAVEAVAHALIEYGTLDAAHCKKIIKQAKRKARRKYDG